MPTTRSTFALAAALVVALGAAGCTTHEAYLVERAPLVALARLPADAPPAAVPAVRASDGRATFVRARALAFDPLHADALPPGPSRVEARSLNRLIAAGSALTWIGTAISLAGTVVFAAGGDALRLPGGLIALSAEPLMWTGTALWIVGALGHPAEVPPGRADMLYLPPAGVDSTPPPSLPATHGAALRLAF